MNPYISYHYREFEPMIEIYLQDLSIILLVTYDFLNLIYDLNTVTLVTIVMTEYLLSLELPFDMTYEI